MRKVLFRCGGIRVYPYPFMLYVGIVSGVISGTYAAEYRGMNPVLTCVAMLVLVIPALVGSRFLYVLSHWGAYRARSGRIWNRADGGASLYGGLILALACSIPLLSLLHLSIGKFWDAATITLAVGMAFTKIGCMLNGCCAGRESNSRFAVRLPDARGVRVRRLPSQLLESAVALLVAGAGAMVWRWLPFDGAFFLAAITVYAAARWVLEGTRHTIDQAAGVSLHRAISLALGGLSFAGFLLLGWHSF